VIVVDRVYSYILNMNRSANAAATHVTPRTAKVFNALPGHPAALGVGFACLLLLLFFGGRIAVDGGAGSTPGDLRLALIHLLMTSYALFAYAYLLKVTGRTADELGAVVGNTAAPTSVVARTGPFHRWGLLVTSLCGVAIYLYATQITTIDSDPWAWGQTNYDSRWMRVIGPLFAIATSCFLYVMVVEAARLSRLSVTITSLDLLDLRPYRVLVRLGLTNALLVVGMASVLMLFIMEPGFLSFVGYTLLVFGVYAWAGLLLPLRGIRKQINRAKDRELDWCRQAMQDARDRLKAGSQPEPGLVEIEAYRQTIERIRNWPFDSPTLIRFSLFLLIPLISMFGGAFVERGVELFLF
jgi:hypothetical protein